MERHTTPTTTIAPIPASQAGALDGYKITCTCGYTQTTSLRERAAKNMAHAHNTWHTQTQKTGN